MSTASHKRIAKNSLVLYLRMLIMMGISIFTTRIVLEGLGVVEFGVYNIVGGVIGFITMITGALTISVQRFLNFELGKEESGRVSDVFSSAIFIHFGLAICVLLLLETVGYWYFSNYINIPVENYQAAMIVYHLSSIAACITLLYSPFLALSISYERMGIYAGVTIIDVVLRLIASYLLLGVPNNRLVIYGELILAVVCISFLVNIAVWQKWFREVSLSLKFHKDLFLQLTSFASWSAMGQIAWAFTLQGSNILLNLFFGNILNAAYGITTQVNGAINKFVQSFQTAINPQIIKNYAQNNYQEVISLVFTGSRLSCFMLMLIIVPLFFEMDIVLNLWLTDVPPYTVLFCRIMVINCIFDSASNYFATAMQATGKIRKYQIIVSILLFMNFPLSYLLLKITNYPYVIFMVYGVVSIVLLFTRIRLVSMSLNIELGRGFLYCVLFPFMKVLIVCIPMTYCLYTITAHMSPVPHLAIFVVGSLIFVGSSIFLLGLRQGERKRIMTFLRVHFLSK